MTNDKKNADSFKIIIEIFLLLDFLKNLTPTYPLNLPLTTSKIKTKMFVSPTILQKFN